MDQSFFVKLTLAAHRVARLLQGDSWSKSHIEESANRILADLILFFEEDYVAQEQKARIAPQTVVEIEILLSYFEKAKGEGSVDPDNFEVLGKEYQKIRTELVRSLGETPRAKAPTLKEPSSLAVLEQPRVAEKKLPVLSDRQRKIIEILRNKEKTQVWELQKVLPQVTKRTLRRDLDDLLQLKLIERQGEWNTVFYTMK